MSRLDEAVAEQILISCHNSIAPDAELFRQCPARREFHFWLQETVDDLGAQRRMYLPPVIAD
jgi:hypothetical protein